MTQLECPNCHETNPKNFEIIDDTITGNKVLGYEDGKLVVNAFSEIAWDCGCNERVLCANCAHTFPVPDDIEIEWK